jgi:hypothetical protein
MKTPRNDLTGSTLLFAVGKLVDILNSYKMYLIKCNNKFAWLMVSFVFT